MANFDHQIITQIKVISQCFVKPKYEVEASKQPYYLGLIDLVLLKADQIKRGLLFSTKPNNIQVDFLEKLKDSLAISLVHYYPLAGRFTTKELPNEDAKSIYLDCTKGNGALLIHAMVDVTVSNLLSSVNVHPIVRSLFDLGEEANNYDGHTRPLLSIQVTELIDGVFIGFTMNHSLVDGTTEWNFINSLSEIFLQLGENQINDIIPISRKPVFKPYFPDGWGPALKLPSIYLYACMTRTNDRVMLRERIFHFSSKSISKLKAKANEECNVQNISSFQALSALIWMSITRAKNLEPELETICAPVMNFRSRCNPPIPNDYFGNYIMTIQSKCKVDELLKNGLGWAAMLIHQNVVSQDDKNVLKYYEMISKFLCQTPKDLGTYYPHNPPNKVVIGGSTRFDMYGPNFGLGKAEAVLRGNCNNKDGKVTASPGREGGGSVDLEVCLKLEFMNALELDEDFMSFVTTV